MSSAGTDGRLAVYYDGSCPLCRREIGFYGRREGAEDIAWIDVAECDPAALPSGAGRAQLMRRFHVRTPDGALKHGAEAFLAVWAALPAFRPAAALGRIPGALPLLEGLYTVFLKFRPAVQRIIAR